jgi:uncharacterized membrane protein
MEPYRLFSGLVLFVGGLGSMVLGVLYANSLNSCVTSSCGTIVIAYLLFTIGIVMITFGAFFIAKANFKSKRPYPRQYSRV